MNGPTPIMLDMLSAVAWSVLKWRIKVGGLASVWGIGDGERASHSAVRNDLLFTSGDLFAFAGKLLANRNVAG